MWVLYKEEGNDEKEFNKWKGKRSNNNKPQGQKLELNADYSLTDLISVIQVFE